MNLGEFKSLCRTFPTFEGESFDEEQLRLAAYATATIGSPMSVGDVRALFKEWEDQSRSQIAELRVHIACMSSKAKS